MPPPKDLSTTKLDAQSRIANFLNNISDKEYRDEKRRYEEKEPLYPSKSWEEFIRLAISRQYLEERSGNPKAEVRNREKLLLRTEKRKNFLGFDKPEDKGLTSAIAALDQRAREYAKKRKAHKSESRHSHHERVEDNDPRRSKRGKTVLVESHHVRRRHKAGEQDAEPSREAPLSIAAPPPRHSQMPSNNDHGNDRNPLHDRRNGQAPIHEYVYPAAPPIVITMPNRSSEPRHQDYQSSPQHHDYQAPPRRRAQTRSHLSSADALYMSGGIPPPAPFPPSRSEHDSHRSDRLPERRETASQSGHGYSNLPSDRHSQGHSSVRESLRNDYSQGRSSVSGSHLEDHSGIKSWHHSMADDGGRAERQERRSGVSRESTRSGRSTYIDESWGSEATVGVPNWGSGGGENGVLNRHERRVSDGHDGRMSESGDSRGHGRSDRGH